MASPTIGTGSGGGLAMMDAGLARAESDKIGQFKNAKAYTPKEARKVATDFESMFLSQMIGHMSEGVKVDKTFGGGHGEEMFKPMLNDEYAKAIAKSGGVGIADSVYRELMRGQEAQAK